MGAVKLAATTTCTSSAKAGLQAIQTSKPDNRRGSERMVDFQNEEFRYSILE
jgi:hypothetical protein